jgi:TRAP transporter TAXI family solute receptor
MLGYTRKHLFGLFAAVLFTVVVVWGALNVLFPAPPNKITIASSFKGGHFEALAARYRDILARDNVQVNALTTEGSVDNLKLLNDLHSGVQIAFMQEGITDSEHSPDLLSLGRIDYQVLWLFYTTGTLVTDLTELKGRRIALGPVGSGSRIVAEKILEISGVTPENSTIFHFAPLDAVKALDDDVIDVAFLSFAPDSQIVRGLLASPRYRLLSIDDAEALTRVFPFLVRLVLPRGTIDYSKKIPVNDVTLIATTNIVLVRKELHPAIIDLLAQAIIEVHNVPGIFQRAGEFPLQTDPEFPIADEALEYYKNGPSLLNRYLPFWIMNYVKRTIAVLLTTVAIIIPIFTYAPRAYKWLIEYRLRTLYRRLRIVEASLLRCTTAEDFSTLEQELDQLDRAALSFRVPTRHSDLYFLLKSHLHLVHNRINKRRAELSKLLAGDTVISAS